MRILRSRQGAPQDGKACKGCDNLIKTDNLSFSYKNTENETPVFENINIEIKKGEFVCILGRNGSGKSTLAKHFNAILRPSEGSVLVEGTDTKTADAYHVRKLVGMVFQNPDNQLVATVVEEDVAFAPENLGVPPEEIRKRVDWALEKVGMTEYKMHATHMLSGGLMQRIAIAGVIAMLPQYIVLDEPTAMLDPSGRREVIETVRKLNSELGITVVLITHNMDEAAQADRILVMNKGELVLSGTPREVFSRVSEMKGFGLDVPQPTEIAFELKKMGFDIKTDVLTEDELIAEIERLSV